MIDDTMGEAIRMTERARIRDEVAALKVAGCTCVLSPGCRLCAHNKAIGEVLAVLDHHTPENRT